VASSWNPMWREGPRWPATMGRCLPATEERVGCSGGDFLAGKRELPGSVGFYGAADDVSWRRNGWGPGARSWKGEERGGGLDRRSIMGDRDTGPADSANVRRAG
jgi:hypothetical protein